MKELFLTSSVHAVAHDIATRLNLTDNNKLVFITTAADIEEGDKSWLENDRQALVDAGFEVVDYTIVGKEYEVLKRDLAPFTYIYLSGGNTFYLLQQSQKSGFIRLIKELIEQDGKVYIGTSAGSIIAGAKCPDYLLEDDEIEIIKDKDGYGFVNFTIVPHWGSEDFREAYLSERLEVAYKAEQVPLILLTDYQYVHVHDEMFEIVDVNR